MAMSEEDRALFAREVARNPRLRAMVSGEVVDALETDPSGVTWLERRVREDLGTAGMELVGARRAIVGAGKLYDMLSEE